MTFYGRWPQNIKIGIFQLPLIGSSSNFNHKLMGPNQSKKSFNEDDIQWKTTSNGRWPQNMKIWISQQPLSRPSSNFKQKLMGSYQNQIRFQWRRHSMEDNIKISSGEQTEVKKQFQWRQPSMDDDLLWKMTSKYENLNISVATDQTFLKF